MEENPNTIASLVEKVETLSKTSYELLRLKTLDKTSKVVSSVTLRLFVFSVIFLFMLLLSIGIGIWLGELLGKLYYGFFIIAAFYAVSAVIIYFFMGDWIKQRISNSIINQVLN